MNTYITGPAITALGEARHMTQAQLAGQLGVSRVKIRDVLSQLEAAGYVTRKRGVGTLINRYVLAEAARLDIDSSYVDIVASYGYTPRATLRKLKLLSPASPILAEKLGFDPAVMASPFITTIVDVLSLLIYFSVASALLGL